MTKLHTINTSCQSLERLVRMGAISAWTLNPPNRFMILTNRGDVLRFDLVQTLAFLVGTMTIAELTLPIIKNMASDE